ncbi:MAG: hypothetical protein HHAS10_03250 [Candidatus Altimarinota bacterium]
MIRRQKTIDLLKQKLDDASIRCIALIGEKGIGKSTLLRELEGEGFFGNEGEYSYIFSESESDLNTQELFKNGITIIDSENSRPDEYWKSIIDTIPEGKKLILTSEMRVEIDTVENITLGIVSFREYADSQGYPVEISKILAGESNTEKLNQLKEVYMERGGFPNHLSNPESISDDFNSKRAIIESKVFKKEAESIMEFMRTLAMNMGNLFKADQIAKLLGISRRKVHKYTGILQELGIIKAIGPWGQNSLTETSRHVKIYFSDLSFVKSLLGDTYNQGTLKQGSIENFIYLELERKLDASHTISYYRKKSGAEITFILENSATETITPVLVTLRESESISQVFKTFDEDYHNKIERYMLVNGGLGGKKDIYGTPFIIIPHVAI